MKTYKIYTAGKMFGLSFNEQMEWRLEIERLIKERTDTPLQFIHPPLYFRYDAQEHKSENEVKQWELSHVRESDIVIVNLNGVNDSTGTHYELSTIDAMNSFGNRHIHAIGIGESDAKIHPWIELSLLRSEEDYEKAADYIVNYLLI